MAKAYDDEGDEGEESQRALAQVCFFKYITLICRLFGLLTFVTLMSVGIHTIVEYASTPATAKWRPRNLDIGIYITCAAVVVLIFESSWIAYRLLRCCQTKNCCHYVFVVILWFDVYKRGILYFVLALPCFLQGIELPLGLLCGLVLCIAAMLYIAKTYKKFGEDHGMSQLTGKPVAPSEAETNEYTKLLEQKSLSTVATQTSEPQSEEEEEMEEGNPFKDDAESTAPSQEASVARPTPRQSGLTESPFASFKSLGKKKKKNKESEEEGRMQVTLETDLEGGNPFGDDAETFD